MFNLTETVKVLGYLVLCSFLVTLWVAIIEVLYDEIIKIKTKKKRKKLVDKLVESLNKEKEEK